MRSLVSTRGFGRAFLLLVAIATAAGGCKAAPKAAPAAAPPPREIDILTLAPSERRETQEYLGQLQSRDLARVSAQATGYVRKIHVRPGQKVAAGAPLIDVDVREEAAALDSARAAQAAAQARLELARQTRARTDALQKEGLANAQEAERARADEASALADTRAAGAQIAQRQVQLQYGVVRAPVAGTVADVKVNPGDYVTPQTTLTSIVGGGGLEVSVSVPAPRARAVTTDTQIELLDQSGKVLVTSQVFFVAASADPLTQLVELKAAVADPAGLRVGETVRARVIYARSQALQVPALAVVRQSGQPFVFVVTDKDGALVVNRSPVQLGALGQANYVVTSGLAAGDRIATSSLQMLRDGAQVKPRAAAVADGTPAPTPAPAGTGTPAVLATPPPPAAPEPAAKPAAGAPTGR